MTTTELKTIATILKRHYSLKGIVTTTEVKDEIRSLARKQAKGSLDDRCEYLAAQIHAATGRDVTELQNYAVVQS